MVIVTTKEVILTSLLVLLLVVAFVLAAAETSLLRVRRSEVVVKLDSGDRRAAGLLRQLDDLPRVLNAVLLAVLLAQVTAAAVAGLLAQSRFGGTGVTVATILMTVLLFVYGEAIPKTIAVRTPYVTARRLVVPVRWLSFVLRPLVSVLVRLADMQSPGAGVTTRSAVSEEELRQLAVEAASTGSIDESDAELIDRSFVLGDLRVDEILVPRVDVVAVSSDERVADALRVAITAGHRRLPVFEGGIDEITGYVQLRDLADAATADPDTLVAERVQDVLVVPESKRVIELLRAMQGSRRHVAVVVDEHGGTAGIVTIEDAVEELIGPSGVSPSGHRPRPGPRRRPGARP